MSSAAPQDPRGGDRPGRSSLRLKLVTVGAVVVVGLAGGVAVGANIGILDSSDSSDSSGVGSLSAAGDLTPSTQVVDVYVDTPTTAAAPSVPVTTAPSGPATTSVAAPGQVFAVDAAGTVTVGEVSGTLQVTAVAPAAGWTWQLEPATSADQVAVTFTDGSRTLHFVGARAADGSIAGRVDEPIVPASTAAPVNGGYGDDDGDDEGGEHEGGGDDD